MGLDTRHPYKWVSPNSLSLSSTAGESHEHNRNDHGYKILLRRRLAILWLTSCKLSFTYTISQEFRPLVRPQRRCEACRLFTAKGTEWTRFWDPRLEHSPLWQHRIGKHALQDYQMQLMLLEQQKQETPFDGLRRKLSTRARNSTTRRYRGNGFPSATTLSDWICDRFGFCFFLRVWVFG